MDGLKMLFLINAAAVIISIIAFFICMINLYKIHKTKKAIKRVTELVENMKKNFNQIGQTKWKNKLVEKRRNKDV